MGNSATLIDFQLDQFHDTSICPFCKKLGEDAHVSAWDKKIDVHLVITISDFGTKDEHCHLHGCIDNSQAMLKIMAYIKNEIDKKTVN